MTDDTISPDDAAEILGVSLAVVLRRIRGGDLPSVEHDGGYLLRREDVTALRAKQDGEEAALQAFAATTEEGLAAARRAEQDRLMREIYEEMHEMGVGDVSKPDS